MWTRGRHGDDTTRHKSSRGHNKTYGRGEPPRKPRRIYELRECRPPRRGRNEIFSTPRTVVGFFFLFFSHIFLHRISYSRAGPISYPRVTYTTHNNNTRTSVIRVLFKIHGRYTATGFRGNTYTACVYIRGENNNMIILLVPSGLRNKRWIVSWQTL